MDWALLLISAALVNNVVLVQFLGLCPFMGVSNRMDSAWGLSLATAFVLTLTSVVAYLIQTFVLVPLDALWLRTLAFIVAIAITVQSTELILRKTAPLLYQVLGLFLPLITTNCAVLGVALLNVNRAHTLLDSAVYGFGAAIGFAVVLLLFSAMRERLERAAIPVMLQGTPIALITAGFMALAFMGFSGMVDR
ncbi:MAG: electron transport complex subunit RsxA [Gammaproteobacteria bacterium]|nr:electron transport complex subunit RsxA [Gammaproteobacteria bacterium]